MNHLDYDNQKVKQSREAKFTQKQLADRLGVTEMTIYRVEAGKVASFKLLSAIAEACETSITSFLREQSFEKSTN